MRALLLAAMLAFPVIAHAQCAGGLIVNCPPSNNLQTNDLVQVWQVSQNPHMRASTLSQIYGATLTLPFASPPPIGSTTPNTGNFTALTIDIGNFVLPNNYPPPMSGSEIGVVLGSLGSPDDTATPAAYFEKITTGNATLGVNAAFTSAGINLSGVSGTHVTGSFSQAECRGAYVGSALEPYCEGGRSLGLVAADGTGGWGYVPEAGTAPISIAVFSGSISGTTLTAGAPTCSGTPPVCGVIAANETVRVTGTQNGTGILAGTRIVSQISGVTGGAGTYLINQTQTVSPAVSMTTVLAYQPTHLIAVEATVNSYANDATPTFSALNYKSAITLSNGYGGSPATDTDVGIYGNVFSAARFVRGILFDTDTIAPLGTFLEARGHMLYGLNMQFVNGMAAWAVVPNNAPLWQLSVGNVPLYTMNVDATNNLLLGQDTGLNAVNISTTSVPTHILGSLTVGAILGAPSYYVNTNQVVGARDTGWTAMTGTADKTTAFATTTVTLAQLAGRVLSLQAALTTHGLIGP
jgi:hypothetical protein